MVDGDSDSFVEPIPAGRGAVFGNTSFYLRGHMKNIATKRAAFQLSPVAAGCAVLVSAMAANAHAQTAVTEPSAEAPVWDLAGTPLTGLGPTGSPSAGA